MRVQRRHVIYVQGYDPRGLAQYYRMFRTELRKSAKLYGLQASVGRPRSTDDGTMASWSIDTQGHGWRTRVAYDFLRWEDLIKDDFAKPLWRTVASAVAIYCRALFAGVIPRIWKAHWRFGMFITYPHFVLLNLAIWSALAAWAAAALAGSLGAPSAAAWIVAAAVFVAALWALLKTTEKRTYALYLMSDTIFTWQFAHRKRPDWDRRIDRFAQHLVEVARTTDAEEVVVVGHSSGSFLGIEIVARALAIDPDLGGHGPRVALLTLGGNLPIVGFFSASGPFREHLKRLAVEPAIDWIDGQSRKDVMNFYPFDPIKGHGIDAGPARRNPTVVPIRFRDMIDPARYNSFRWQFFRVHFQFVMASERPHPYDFYLIVCSPVALADRVKNPAGALAAATAATGPAAEILPPASVPG
ncbi:MAG: alpha/beta hydrolase [Xanthobacteraceae bacterium]